MRLYDTLLSGPLGQIEGSFYVCRIHLPNRRERIAEPSR